MVKKYFTYLINITPFVMIVASGVFAYFSHKGWFVEVYRYLGDSIGYSILTNLVFIKYYHRKAYCNPTKLSVYGLLLMNVINLFVIMGVIQGRYWYDIAISFTVIGVILIGVIKRW